MFPVWERVGEQTGEWTKMWCFARKCLAVAGAFVASLSIAAAQDAEVQPPRALQNGDCVEYREEGAGLILKTPSYWVRGRVVESYRSRHTIGLCPDADKPRSRYGREEWKRFAAAYPCAWSQSAPPEGGSEITVLRVRFAVTAWETPWTRDHGQNGWLYRGHFLDTALKEGVVLDVDASLLGYCAER